MARATAYDLSNVRELGRGEMHPSQRIVPVKAQATGESSDNRLHYEMAKD